VSVRLPGFAIVPGNGVSAFARRAAVTAVRERRVCLKGKRVARVLGGATVLVVVLSLVFAYRYYFRVVEYEVSLSGGVAQFGWTSEVYIVSGKYRCGAKFVFYAGVLMRSSHSLQKFDDDSVTFSIDGRLVPAKHGCVLMYDADPRYYKKMPLEVVLSMIERAYKDNNYDLAGELERY
jgi:hypothetical protein